MIRIKLTHGSARVSEQILPETVEILNNLVTLAYNQVSNTPENKEQKT